MDKYFWFSQPSSILSNLDLALGIVFMAFLALGIILRIIAKLIKNPMQYKLLIRFYLWFFWVGFSGTVWFGFRYENTPIFAKRFWLGLIAIVAIIWLAWLVKYLVFGFRKELRNFSAEAIKRKYMPGSNR